MIYNLALLVRRAVVAVRAGLRSPQGSILCRSPSRRGRTRPSDGGGAPLTADCDVTATTALRRDREAVSKLIRNEALSNAGYSMPDQSSVDTYILALPQHNH